MSTLVIPRDRLNEVHPGDRIVALDGGLYVNDIRIIRPPEPVRPGGPVGMLIRVVDNGHEGYLYPDSMIGESITVERDDPEPVAEDEVSRWLDEDREERMERAWGPETGTPIAAALSPGTYIPEGEIAPAPAPPPAPPTVFLHERERKALRRNPHYVETLRLLSHPTGAAVNLRTRVAAESRANYFGPRYYSHQAGMLARWYGWCERSDAADYTWRLTPAGRRVLAALDAGMGGRRR
jgi:hypothetical protein